VLTSFVHDPTPRTLPQCHTASTVRYFDYFVRNTMPRLRRIAVPSEAVRQDVVRLFRVPEEKVSVIYHGVSEDFFDSPPTAGLLLRQTYNLPEHYILFVGTLEPRKNLLTLLRAYTALREELRRAHPLVVVGMTGWRSREIREAYARRSDVHVVGYVRPTLLPALYHSASLFVMPSLYEGFCMPLLEAMAACLPIVASNWSALPEIAGDAAMFFDPNSAHELTDAMERVLDTPRLASALAESGRQRARQLTWDATAVQTKAFFEQALGSEQKTD
jgi:alpha-1,3-rhamnosyl/mannosyltransferase